MTFLSKVFLDMALKRKEGVKSAVINLSSVCADYPSLNLSAYAGGKAYVSLFGQSMALENPGIVDCLNLVTGSVKT
jgi:short-subunit dehydrogenase